LNHIEIYKYKVLTSNIGEKMKKSFIILGVVGIIAILMSGFIIGTLFIGKSQYSKSLYDEGRTHAGGYSPVPDSSSYTKTSATSYAESQDFSSNDRRVVKSGNANIEVESFDSAISKIKEMAKNYDGYVTNSNMWIYDSKTKYGNITVKIPESKFEEFGDLLTQVGTIKSKEISSYDVTEEYIDLQARLKNLKNQEKRYTELLDMAKDVNEVLAVEAQLSRVRGEIESLEGRIKYLDNTTSYGTFYINIYEPEEVVHEFGLKKAFDRAIEAFIISLTGIIIITGFLLPILIGIGIIYFVVKYLKKRVKRE